MRRILEIIAEIRKKHPRDDFFPTFESSCRDNPAIRQSYRTYDDALVVLDEESWQILKCKALRHYMDHRTGYKKNGFFNHLNEAFAYRYLVRKGFANVRFIKEIKGNKSPDIGYSVNDSQRFCEVKTQCITDKEIVRRNTGEAYDISLHKCLNAEFLTKFHNKVIEAQEQIRALGSDGLVYLIINFDDFTLNNYQVYRKQLILYSEAKGFNNLFIKIGTRGNKRIYITKR